MVNKFIAVLIPIFLVGCFGSVSIKKDNFSGSTVVSMKDRIMAEEVEVGVGFIRCDYEFTRNFANGKKGPIIINIEINASNNLPDLTKNVMLKIDSNMNNLTFGVINKSINISATLETKGDSAKAKASAYNIYHTTLTLNTNTENSILKCNSLTMRLLFGNKNATYNISGNSLKNIKNFISTIPQ